MMLLDLIWFAVVVGTMVFVPRRSHRATIGLICVVALLFPIISASDDFSTDRAMIERASLAVVAAIALAFVSLVALGRIERVQQRLLLVHVATPSDPRSPPRA